MWFRILKPQSAQYTSLPPDAVRRFCKNYAVDAVLHYYGEQAVRQQTDMEVSVQMEEETIIPQPEFCALLGNLLENAIDACAGSKAPRIIRLSQLFIHAGNILPAGGFEPDCLSPARHFTAHFCKQF